MRSNLSAVMPHVFAEEGGYVDHPRDPGGATNLGITKATLENWRGHSVSKADVKALTKAEAAKIYEARYAKPVRFDDLPSGVDYAVLDFCINSGPGRAIKTLQRVVGVAQDGAIGQQTLAAVKSRSAVNVINALCDARLGFLKGLGTWDAFGKGWSKRVERVRHKALQMAGTHVPQPPPDIPPIDHPVPVPKPGKGGAVGVGAAIGAAIVAILTFIANALGWI